MVLSWFQFTWKYRKTKIIKEYFKRGNYGLVLFCLSALASMRVRTIKTRIFDKLIRKLGNHNKKNHNNKIAHLRNDAHTHAHTNHRSVSISFSSMQFLSISVHKCSSQVDQNSTREHNSLSHFFDFDGNFFLLLPNKMKYRQFVFLFFSFHIHTHYWVAYWWF